jgi:hypothetical protein
LAEGLPFGPNILGSAVGAGNQQALRDYSLRNPAAGSRAIPGVGKMAKWKLVLKISPFH